MGNITGRPTVAATGLNSYLASNDGDEQIDLSFTDNLAVQVTASNTATIADTASAYDFTRNILFILTANGVTATTTILVPTTLRGFFIVKNVLGFDATVGISGQGEAVDTVPDGTSSVFSSDGVNVRIAGGGASVTNWLALTDTPSTFSGQDGKVPQVNTGETALELVTLPSAVSVPPDIRHVRVLLTSLQAITASSDTDIAWDNTEESTLFDPQDGGLTQRMWLGINWTFVDGDVTVGSDQIAETAHGYLTGEGPVRLTNSGGALPAGLAVNTNYWIIRVDDDNLKFADNRADAIAGTATDITAAAGGGTHTVDQEDYIVVPANVAKVEFAANADWATATDLARQITIKKRNASDADVDYEGRPASRVRGQDDSFQNIKSDAISVSEGDRFVLEVRHNSATSPLNLEATDMTWFSMRIMEEATPFTYPGVTVTPPFRGAIVRPAADETGADYTVDAVLSFDEEDFDSDGFHDNATNNSRLTIPTGLGITKVRVGAQLTTDLMATISALRFRVVSTPGNEAANIGMELDSGNVSTTDQTRFNLISPVIDVSDTDYFELFLRVLGDTDFTIQHAATMFWIEVVETDENAFPPEEIHHFTKLPTTTDTLWMKVFNRRTTLNDALAGSEGWAEGGANGGIVVYDIEIDDVKVGDFTWADTTGAAAAATLATEASQQYVIDVGSNLKIISPADVQSMTDVSFNIAGFRS